MKVTQPGSVVTTMTYNADGLRVRKENAAGVVKSIWDFQNVLLETDGANATQAVYTLAPRGYGILISQRRGATSHFALYDALGSVIALTNAAGAISDSYRYKGYGSDLVVSGSTVNPFRWVGLLGYYYDAGLGTYYIRERHYRTLIGRWMSEDPLGYGFSPWNLFRYVKNSPSTVVDPSGLYDIGLPIYPPGHVQPPGWGGGVHIYEQGNCPINGPGSIRAWAQQACDCFAEAAELLASCPEAVAEHFKESVFNPHLTTKDGQAAILAMLQCALKKCSKPISVQCEKSSNSRCDPGRGTDAYVLTPFGIPCSTIHLCPGFFTTFTPWTTFGHEVGRLCDADDSGTVTDVVNFDNAFKSLCAQQEEIRSRCNGNRQP